MTTKSLVEKVEEANRMPAPDRRLVPRDAQKIEPRRLDDEIRPRDHKGREAERAFEQRFAPLK